MKKFLFGVILVLIAISAYFAWGAKGVVEKKVVVHDTIYRDSVLITERETEYYDAQWLRSQFQIAQKDCWKNYVDSYKVEYPEFMKMAHREARGMRVAYRDISLDVMTYDDKYDMTIEEKYEAINMTAATKSIADSSFLMAGRSDQNKRFFEKDIKLKGRTWMYLRVEFPREMTWAVDPLLHYVKDYQPK